MGLRRISQKEYPSIMKQTRRVFLSSTVYDLGSLRGLVKRAIEILRTDGGIRFECYASEFPDYPLSLKDVRYKHSYDLCIDAVKNSDVLVLLLKRRYGAPLIPWKRRSISITEREYLEARRSGIPVLVFLDQRTWNARNRWRKNREQRFVTQEELFHFVDRIQGRPENPQPNWMTIYRTSKEIKTRLRTTLVKFDDSRFITERDPDNTIVSPSQVFKKTWRIKNAGVRIWKGRYLQEENPARPGLVPHRRKLNIPVTRPGQEIDLSVSFRAPATPGMFVSYWKMRDRDARYCFPDKEGLSCQVLVRRHRLGFRNAS